MRILWISSVAWQKDGNFPFPVSGAGAVAGSLFQQSLIEGLEALGHSVDIICDYPYGESKKSYPEYHWSHNEKSKDVAVKMISIPYLSILYKDFSLSKQIKKNCRENKYDVAIAYLIHQPYMSALYKIKKIQPDIKTVLICPDLPDMMDMSLSSKRLKLLLKKIDMLRINKLYEFVDGFVLFTELMKERIPIKEKPYEVIEGVATFENLNIAPVEKENFIMYGGVLHKNIGIENIIESMNFLDGIYLKIYGTGELEEYVKDAAARNPRIIFNGFVDRDILFEEEKKATALVNVRSPEEPFTKYSFPSKTFEYLYSKTPVVTTKLEGIPKEYFEFLFSIDNNEPQIIAAEIKKILNSDSDKLEKHGQCAREFIKTKKNKKVQAEKLMAFVDRL